jgi:CBS domain-containing protein
LGFTKVFDYMAGKLDWAAYGLPMEKKDGAIYVGDHLQRQVPICALRDSIATVKERLAQSKMDLCAVVNQHGVVLGACEAESLGADASRPVEEVMQNAPKTLRPSYPIEAAAKLLQKSGKTAILVTSSDGKLMGLFTNSG